MGGNCINGRVRGYEEEFDLETIIDTTVLFTICFVLFPQMFTASQRYIASTQMARDLAQSV